MSAKKNSRLRRTARARITPKPAAVNDPFAASAAAEATMLLALAAPVAGAPSAKVKSALLARIAAAKTGQKSGWRIENVAAKHGWVKLPIPGVRLREVTVDAARDTVLLFIEMAPGAIFPDHDHTTAERGLVLSGNIVMDGQHLGAGDFYEAAASTRHERITSPDGCTGLLWVGAEAWRHWRALAIAR